MEHQHKTDPEYYEGSNLSQQASEDRARNENLRDAAYEKAEAEKNPILRQKAFNLADYYDNMLDMQGANPKVVDFGILRDHVQSSLSPNYDDMENKYKKRIKNRATAIRAYCVSCQGGSVADVRICASVTCPLHPFRMGKDPLRGYAIPKEEEPELELEDDNVGDFEEGDDGSDADAD